MDNNDKIKINLNSIQTHETVLIFSKPKTGKSWAYLSAVEKCIEKGGRVFLLNTDNGVKLTLNEYFGDRAEEISNKINYYFIDDIEKVKYAIDDIKKNVEPNSLIIIDLISQLWELAQEKVINMMSADNPIGYLLNPANSQKIGNLDNSKWIIIKKLDSLLLNELVIRPPCKVIAVATAKELAFDKLHTNRGVLDQYESVGAKPGGQPMLSYYFNTVVYLGVNKNSQHYFVLLGDRGQPLNMFQKVEFGRDFWSAFQEARGKRR